jgi:hypothetical protein
MTRMEDKHGEAAPVFVCPECWHEDDPEHLQEVDQQLRCPECEAWTDSNECVTRRFSG